ncbi:phosphomevalonate kinase isoform X2 [Oratosquilla oratoria]|uniref:phosphomevalonate kinase isoform X2 n=1 Tax=Oratosquilla oratoria TaxID=337810 RepID=UPI003F7634D5
MPDKKKIILLFCGKRKSGKDYITDLLHERLQDKEDILNIVVKLSGPIKSEFAKTHDLDYKQLLTASDYKEKYRIPMIEWSEAKRNEDSGYFIRAAIEMYSAPSFPVWIVSDMRRRSDLAWFKEHHSEDLVKTVRISATEDARKQRGWVFTQSVDDAETECDLDSVHDMDWCINNSGDEKVVQDFLQTVVDFCKEYV